MFCARTTLARNGYFWKNDAPMLTKEQVTDVLNELPGPFTLDELGDRLIFIQKAKEGVNQSEQGEVYSTEEARTMLKQWPA